MKQFVVGMFLFVGLIGVWMSGCQIQEQKVEKLIKQLQEQDVSVRAAKALGQIGTPEALKAVEEYGFQQ